MSLIARNLAMILFLFFCSANSCVAGGVGEYQLGSGDRIKVNVLGEPELSDELLIDSAGNVEMPLIGSVHVIGKTVTEARALITQRLQNSFLKEPVVTVLISELRPIFVIGDVRRPGQHPFKFGLTVLSAVAMAGGFGSERLRQGEPMAALIAAEERLHVLSRRYADLIVRLARIEAERNDQEHFDVPKLPEMMSDVDMTDLTERELERLNSSRRHHQRLLQLLSDRKPTVEREIEARKQEILAQTELIQTYEKQLARISSIKLERRILELRTQIAQSQGLLSRLRGEIAALEEKLVALDIQAEEVINKREKRIISELADTRQQWSEVDASLPSVIETVQLRRRQAGQIFENDDWQRSYEISLKSNRSSELKKVSGLDPTYVEPGDTVLVRMIRPPDGRQPSTMTDGFSSPGISSRKPHRRPASRESRPGA